MVEDSAIHTGNKLIDCHAVYTSHPQSHIHTLKCTHTITLTHTHTHTQVGIDPNQRD